MAQPYTTATAPVSARPVPADTAAHIVVTRPLFVLGRAIFGGYFLYSGVQHFLNTSSMAAYAASKGVPFPESSVMASGALLVAGSVCVLLGILPRLGAAMIALFLLCVTPIMHAFWLETGEAAMADRIQFTKNVALFGAACLLAAIPGPWPVRVFHRHPPAGE
jgi:uncharacterized membrane protein YphA (DoxX/SURF4 family)